MEVFGSPRIRSVKKHDLQEIAQLEATAFGTNSLTRSALDVIFDPSGDLWLLAEDDQGIWGHSVNARGEDPRVGWIVGMAIHPDRQRRGWGHLLLHATLKHLRYYDMDVIRLLVKPTNKIARDLYMEFGFLDTGARADHFGPGEDRIVMSLLTSSLLIDPGFGHPDGMLVPQVPWSADHDWAV